MNPAVGAPLHEALGPPEGEPPPAAKLTDQQRLAVLLQAAALLGYLERAGHSLADGWASVRVSAGGRLTGVESRRGRDDERPQRRAEQILLALFNAETTIAGRGEARRASRRLLDLWRQDVTAVPPDRLVAQILAVAPFLWQEAFGDARAALAAELPAGDSAGSVARLWVAGPGGFRRRLLALCDDLSALQSVLAGDEARRQWGTGDRDADPMVLLAARRWRRAVEAWSQALPPTADERLGLARALYALGRFAAAKQALHGLRREPARILRLGCQLRLGELTAAKRALGAWRDRPLDDDVRLDLAAVAVRLHASLGNPAGADEWLEAARGATTPRARLWARLLTGESAWDRGELDEVERAIEATAELAEDPELGWRRCHLRALLAMARGDGAGVVAGVGAALASRRGMRPFEAAGLWNDLAIGRSLCGDLAGAERALRHVTRLTDETEGDRRLTLALCNLAEVRLRRGKTQGVRDVLTRAARANLQAGNWRGWAQDRELETRLTLVRGRPGAALAVVEETLERLAERSLDWRRGPLQVLAARAHGWLGDAAAARAALAETTEVDRRELEPEERVPLLALAGDLDRALEENPPGPCRALWRSLVGADGEIDWSALDRLEPYRAARAVFDAELLAPGRVPEERRRMAAAQLRRVGAEGLADRLAATGTRPWRPLEDYLEAEGPIAERLRLLMRAVCPEARLTWRDAESEVEVVEGVGGRDSLEAPVAAGDLRISAPRIGGAERMVLALARRDLPPRSSGARRRPPRQRHGMIGESPAILEALDRLSKLAGRELPILIRGETGTGKELAARLVHGDSHRAGGPFLPVNCAALAENLLLSELFGHVKGAFTGADRDRAGIFEAARGGTVLLDEIGDLPLPAQGKLLRVLQEREVRRVGESVARPVDVRVVAATHHDLAAMVDAGDFRKDLFYRLNVGQVVLPPLCERGQDLPLLMEHFLAQEGEGLAPRLSSAARSMLMAHSWPGNVRELRNVLTVAVALSGGETIEPRHLDLPAARPAPRGSYHERVEDFRRELVAEAVAAAGGNRAEAARQLGLSRQALSYLTRQLDIG